jgi:hypothetical protein
LLSGLVGSWLLQDDWEFVLIFLRRGSTEASPTEAAWIQIALSDRLNQTQRKALETSERNLKKTVRHVAKQEKENQIEIRVIRLLRPPQNTGY